MSDDLPFHSLTELSRLLARGETTSQQIVAACIARIDALDDRLHAFVDVYRDSAASCAQAADLERRAGIVRGPLHGLPIALKDLLHIEGRQTTAGSKSWLGRKSAHTATVVRRLVAAGMIPVGKTHMVEFAFGAWGRNEPMGAPWNPWDTRTHRAAGGSSSGSAVAVASGLAPAAIGSDTGGSVRIPASLCNLTGLKTTHGLISLANVVPLSTTLDTVGPLTRTADDAALLTAAMAGADDGDPATLVAPHLDFTVALAGDADLRGVRIACLSSDQLPAIISSDVLRAFQLAVDVLRDQGAIVEEVSFPFDLDDVVKNIGRLIATEAYAVHRAYIEDPQLPIDPWVRKRMLSGKSSDAADYIELLQQRRREAGRFAEWMRGRDAMLTPTLPITAVPVNAIDESTTLLSTFTRPANYLGACALTLPAGVSAEGLPIGIQLMGAAFTEPTLVRIGRGFQRVTDWHLRRPDLSAWERRAVAAVHE